MGRGYIELGRKFRSGGQICRLGQWKYKIGKWICTIGGWTYIAKLCNILLWGVEIFCRGTMAAVGVIDTEAPDEVRRRTVLKDSGRKISPNSVSI